MERRDHTLPVSGLNLHVIDWGDKTAPPVVMLHGIRGFAETFAGLAAALQPGRRILAVDQRGRGESDWDPGRNYYTDTYVSDLEGIVDQLELARFDLLGHSMGGINAIVYAARHPGRVRSLVIEDAGPGAFDSSAGANRIRQEFATTPDCFESWEAATRFMQALRPGVTEAARQLRLRRMLKPLVAGGYTWRHDQAGIAATRLDPAPSQRVDLVPHISRLACATLVVRGGRTDYLQPEMLQQMLDLNPRLAGVVIPDASHYIHDDQPERFAAVVVQFLKQDDG